MTTDAIRVMEGPALTKLAVQLGLMNPEHFHSPWETGGRFINLSRSALFAPHEEIAQADAVFRSLRARGWNMRSSSHATGGTVFAEKRSWIRCYWSDHRASEDSECLALLRCAVLAVSGAQKAASE